MDFNSVTKVFLRESFQRDRLSYHEHPNASNVEHWIVVPRSPIQRTQLLDILGYLGNRVVWEEIYYVNELRNEAGKAFTVRIAIPSNPLIFRLLKSKPADYRKSCHAMMHRILVEHEWWVYFKHELVIQERDIPWANQEEEENFGEMIDNMWDRLSNLLFYTWLKARNGDPAQHHAKDFIDAIIEEYEHECDYMVQGLYTAAYLLIHNITPEY